MAVSAFAAGEGCMEFGCSVILSRISVSSTTTTLLCSSRGDAAAAGTGGDKTPLALSVMKGISVELPPVRHLCTTYDSTVVEQHTQASYSFVGDVVRVCANACVTNSIIRHLDCYLLC